MGWTGGFVLLALLLAPYLRKFGKYTVPDFVGDRYYSVWARLVAVVAALFVSLTYVAGQMRGVGIVFSRFLQVDITTGVIIGMVIVAFFAVLGGMKGITWTQVAQYGVLIIAYLILAIAILVILTDNPIPQLAFSFSDIIVLSTPEVAKLAPWVIALVATGGLAAALSTASGLLLVISSSIAHDVYYRIINPNATEAQRLMVGRVWLRD